MSDFVSEGTSPAVREAEKLKRLGDIEGVYTVVMVVGILVLVGFIEALGFWVMPIAVALFVPKVMLYERWQRQLDVVCAASPVAMETAKLRGYR